MQANKRKNQTRGNKYPKVQRKGRMPVSWKIDYQYSENIQQMGPGTTMKNFEKVLTITANNFQNYTLSDIVGDDFDVTCRGYRYIKVLGVCVTQNAINLTNEQESVYVRVSWPGDFEEQEDILEDDAAKVLPNIGRKRFIFKPPNAQIPFTKNSTTISANLSEFASTAILAASGVYTLPGIVSILNATASARKVKIIVRVMFRGSKVLDKVEAAKRVLKKEGYLVLKKEDEKEEEKEKKP
jgi:hypothetical protein